MEKNFFWSNKRNGTNITKNCFAPQNQPHTAKQNFLGVLKHFHPKLTKKNFCLRFFLNEFEIGKILGKVFLMETLFVKPV